MSEKLTLKWILVGVDHLVLDELFGELGIESVEEDGVGINSDLELSLEKKYLIDRVIQEFIYQYGEQKSLEAKLLFEEVTWYYGIDREILDYAAERFWHNINNSLSILNLEYTANIDEWYLGWIYFETDRVAKGLRVEVIESIWNWYSSEVIHETEELWSIHSALVSSTCITACNIYIKAYVLDFQGNVEDSEIMVLKYDNGVENNIDASSFIWFGGTTITSENIQIHSFTLLTKVIAGLSLVSMLTCTDDIWCIWLWGFWKIWDTTVWIIKATKKRVLELSSKTKTDKLITRIWDDWASLSDDILKVRVAKILKDSEVNKTLERIKKWEGKYSKDWTIFNNNESLLPIKEGWYYKEWTVDTPWISTRWSKRIVVWNNGEKYYTNDHYSTFIKIN